MNKKNILKISIFFKFIPGIALVAIIIVVSVYTNSRYFTHKIETADCSISDTTRIKLMPYAIGDMALFNSSSKSINLKKIQFTDVNGKKTGISDFTEKLILLNLWATWCVPCRDEMPALDILQEKLGSKNFQVIPISVDLGGLSKPKKFYSEIGIHSLKLYHDKDIQVFNKLKSMGIAFGLPSTILIGKDGCSIGSINGPAEWSGSDAINMISAIL